MVNKEKIEDFNNLFEELKSARYEENKNKVKEIEIKINNLVKKIEASGKNGIKIVGWDYSSSDIRSSISMEENGKKVDLRKKSSSYFGKLKEVLKKGMGSQENLNLKLQGNGATFVCPIPISKLNTILLQENIKEFWVSIDKGIKNSQDFDALMGEAESMFKEFNEPQKSSLDKMTSMIDRSLNPSQKVKDTQNRIDNILKKIANDLNIKIGGYSIKGDKLDYIKDGNEHKVDLSKISKENLKNLEEAIKILSKETSNLF